LTFVTLCKTIDKKGYVVEPATEKVLDLLGGQRLTKEVKRSGLVEVIRQGLPMAAAIDVAQQYGLSDVQVAHVLGISPRTLARHKTGQKPLNAVQSDRIFRLARVASHAEEVFESRESALDWLKSPNRALGGAVPLELLDTDAGTVMVDEVLTRIDYGVYS
jgi:putative toxin-antitoxin system antitoxin component (TIGR02293 family)